MQYLMIKTHSVTGLKYLCQTTRKDPYSYKGSGTYWNSHCKKHGYDFTTEVIFQSTNKKVFERVSQEYSKTFNVVESKAWANLIEEHGGSMGSKANPNHNDGKFTGRLDDAELYKKLDKQKHLETWGQKKIYAQPRMKFFYYKRKGNRDQAEYYWNKWYELAPKNSNNRQALWITDTFEMWWDRVGNELNFRSKVDNN